ncbi:MAG: DUF433 domain-containing protein [Chitinophagaceae bacterium]|nr:DUF433 domain-containing protein [Chitinophagaceae bacterium]
MNNWRSHIEFNKEIRFGKPIIKGTRIAVSDILKWLASEMSYDDILRDYPSLTREHIYAALAFSADREVNIKTIAA